MIFKNKEKKEKRVESGGEIYRVREIQSEKQIYTYSENHISCSFGF